MNTAAIRLLIADDEEHTRTALVRAFQLKGYQCQGATNGQDALNILNREKYDLLLLDLRMPEMDGVQVMIAAQQLYPELMVIILTAHASLDSAITAVKAGAADYLIKPQSINELENAVQRALKKQTPALHRNHLISFMQQTLDELKSNDPLIAPDPGSSLVIDEEKRLFIFKGVKREFKVNLTGDQTKILQVLYREHDRVLTCSEIALKALGYPDLSEKEAESMVRPHILRIRRKIEEDPEKPQLLRTVRGCGYLFSLNSDSAK